MAGPSWSSSSSCTSSLGSLDDDDAICVVAKPDAAEGGVVKFLCSYGGRILPRHSDGALRYVGGDNRVLSVDRSLHFYELQRKLREMCGGREVSLRCQLPTEDLDALVAVTSDDDLANLLEEYDAAAGRGRLQPPKIRAFLFPRTPSTPPPSPPPTPPPRVVSRQPPMTNARLHRQNTSPAARVSPRWWAAAPPQASRPAAAARATVALPPQLHAGRHDPGGEVPPPHHRYLVHNGSHWQ
ncbi:hypothetical protein ACP70R_000057 [Stipagrostis hirtigluma subsp. patula]